MSRETKGRHVKAKPARLDAEGTAQPKTKLILHQKVDGNCRARGLMGAQAAPGEVLDYQGEDGERTPINVVPTQDNPYPYTDYEDCQGPPPLRRK
jgi:hypothetical protein